MTDQWVLDGGGGLALWVCLLADASARAAPPPRAVAPNAPSERLPRLRVHASGRHLETDDARPFFYMMLTIGQVMRNDLSMIRRDGARRPIKPVLDAEPAYERHPASFNPQNGFIGAFHVRRHAYWALFAGACGHTYGHHDIWPMRKKGDPTPAAQDASGQAGSWQEALGAPGAVQTRKRPRTGC